MNHLCPDMEIGLREGWKGLLEKIRYYRKKNNPPDPDFYEGRGAALCWGSWRGKGASGLCAGAGCKGK